MDVSLACSFSNCIRILASECAVIHFDLTKCRSVCGIHTYTDIHMYIHTQRQTDVHSHSGIHIYTDIHAQLHIHTYITYSYIHTTLYINTYIHTKLYIRTHQAIHIYIHTQQVIYKYIHTHLPSYTYIHTHTASYIHTYIHTKKYIYYIQTHRGIHTYTPKYTYIHSIELNQNPATHRVSFHPTLSLCYLLSPSPHLSHSHTLLALIPSCMLFRSLSISFSSVLHCLSSSICRSLFQLLIVNISLLPLVLSFLVVLCVV